MNNELEEKLAQLNEQTCVVNETCASITCSRCIAKKILSLINDFYLTRSKEGDLLLTDDEIKLIVDPSSSNKQTFFSELSSSYNYNFINYMCKEISRTQFVKLSIILDGYKSIILAIRSWICAHSVVNPETDDLYMDYTDEEEKKLNDLISKALNVKNKDEIDGLILALLHKVDDKSTSKKEERVNGEWQRCPICNGVGFVSGGYFNRPGDVMTWQYNSLVDTCRICEGKGIIVKPKP